MRKASALSPASLPNSSQVWFVVLFFLKPALAVSALKWSLHSYCDILPTAGMVLLGSNTSLCVCATMRT